MKNARGSEWRRWDMHIHVPTTILSNKYKHKNIDKFCSEIEKLTDIKVIGITDYDYRKNPPTPYNKLKVPGNLWYFNRVRYKMKEYVEHSSQKPEILLERIVKASSNEGDFILDLFSGSFSLGVVSKRLNRNYIGIEKSKKYCLIGEERIKDI